MSRGLMGFVKSPLPMLIGYARVSTLDQNLDLQTDALTRAGCESIYQEKASSRKHRPELEQALKHLRPGDTLVVWKLDRLGRTVKDLIEMVGELDERGVHFRSLTDNIDTSTASGRFFFHVMASLAQMERELLHERTMAGLAAAKAQGRTGGAPVKMTKPKQKRAKELLASGVSYKEVAQLVGVSLTTLYRFFPKGESGFISGKALGL